MKFGDDEENGGRRQTNSMRHYVRVSAESNGGNNLGGRIRWRKYAWIWLARVLLDQHAGYVNGLQIDDAVGMAMLLL